MRGSMPSRLNGGSSMRSSPAGEPTLRQRPRASSCGWRQNSSMLLRRALAISAASSLSITWSEVELRENPVDLGVQRVAVLQPCRAGGKPRVGGESGGAQHRFAEPGELALVLHAQEHGAAVAGAERAVGHDGRVVGPGARRRRAAVAREIGREAHPLGERLEHRDVERRPLAGPAAPDEGSEDGRERVHPRGDVGDRDAGLRRLLGRSGDRKQPGFALHQEVVGLLGGIGARRPVAGDPAPDEPRVLLPQARGRPGRGARRRRAPGSARTRRPAPAASTEPVSPPDA